MTELIEITIALLISLIFAAGEISVTLYANDKTTNELKKHIDESVRQLSDKLAEIKGDKKPD